MLARPARFDDYQVGENDDEGLRSRHASVAADFFSQQPLEMHTPERPQAPQPLGVGFEEEVPGLLGPDPSDDEEDEFNDAEEVRDEEGIGVQEEPVVPQPRHQPRQADNRVQAAEQQLGRGEFEVQLEEGKFDLRPFLSGELPGPSEVASPSADGWGEVDTWDVWECGLCPFRTLEGVPLAFREKFSKAVLKILQRHQLSTSAAEESRCLKWFLLIGQLFLREGKRGGNKGQGHAEINARFDLVSAGDWGGLLNLLSRDKERLHSQPQTSRKQGTARSSKEADKLRKTVLGMLARGQVSKAVRRMTNHGIACFEEDWVKQALAAKYRERGRELQESVLAGQCIDSLPGLKEALLNLCPGVSPGFGGLRNEHLGVLADVWSEEELQVFEKFCMRYLQGTLQPWFYTVWGSVTTVPAFKSAEKDSLRPLGIKSSLIRVLHKEVVKGNRQPLTEYLEPQQLALSEAGGFILVHSVRMMAEQMRDKPDWVVVKLDVANAHNEVSRAAVVEVLESVPELQHLAQHAATYLAGHQGLEVNGRLWGRNGEGKSQGDPEASPLFCIAWHPFVQELDARLAAVGGKSLFGNDDGYLVGPASIILPALEHFSTQIQEHCLLRLQLSKTEVFSWEATLPPQVPQGMKRAGEIIDGRWEPGFLCYGIAVGTDCYVQKQLDDKMQEIAGQVRSVLDVLGPHKDFQAIWAVLNCSLAQKFDWQLSLNYPSDVIPAAARLDTCLWEALEFATSFHIPFEDEGLGVECVLNAPGLPLSLQQRSFQQWLVRPFQLSRVIIY